MAVLDVVGIDTTSGQLKKFVSGDTVNGAGSGDMTLAGIQTVTGAKTFNSGKMIYAGATSGVTTLNAASVAGTTTITMPALTGTMVLDTTTSLAGFTWFLDEDAMTSNSDTKTASQQSIKAYVDAAVAGGVQIKGGYDASTDTPSLDDGTPIAGILQGDMYFVTVAGTFFTEDLAIGDSIVANQDSPTTLSHWTRIQRNLTDPVVASAVSVGTEASDPTCFPTFVTANTGDLAVNVNNGLTFNSSTGTFSATSFSGNLTGNVTGNADTATTSTNVTAANEATDTTCFLNFTTAATGTVGIKTNSALAFNSNTGMLTLDDVTLNTLLFSSAEGGGAVVEQKLSTTTGIDGTAVATTNLYTVPSGKTAVITRAVVRVTTATAITVAGTAGIGIAAGEDDIFNSTTLTGITTTTSAFMFSNTFGKFQLGAATNVIKFGIDTGYTATVATLAVDLFGYLL